MKTSFYCLKAWSIVVSFALGVELVLASSLPARSQSNTALRGFSSNPIVFQEHFEPPGDGEPESTVGAGSRDSLSCSKEELPIHVLMPERNYGLTLQERPQISIYLPETSAQQVLLSFQEESGENYQRVFLPISRERGITSFALPDSAKALTAGKNYQWSLSIVCGEAPEPDNPVFRGWVQRVETTPEFERELSQKSPIEQANWYGERGYWYDMLAVMLEARQLQPDDLDVASLWQNLLTSVGLDEVASKPLK
jgi:Domain of Unknown Function (DUF928)